MVKKSSRITLKTGEGFMDIVKSVGKTVAPALIDLASEEAKRRAGGGFMDIVKSVGKTVAPALIDLASEEAKRRAGGGIPVMMSPAQLRKLKTGGAITINPSMIMEEAKHAIMTAPDMIRKLMSAMKKGKGMRYTMRQGDQVIDRRTGKGLFDIVKSVGKVVAPALIDIASQEAKKKVGSGRCSMGGMIGIPTGAEAGRQAQDFKANYDATHTTTIGPYSSTNAFGRGIKNRKKSVMMVGGVPKVSKGGDGFMSSAFKALAPVAIDLATEEAKRRIGGGIYPAGKYGRGMEDPIQLGSPYLLSNSPAMSPFIPSHSQLSGYNPIKQGIRQGRGIDPISVISGVMDTILP